MSQKEEDEIRRCASELMLGALRDGKQILIAPRQTGKTHAIVMFATEKSNRSIVVHNHSMKKHINEIVVKINGTNNPQVWTIDEFVNMRGIMLDFDCVLFDEFAIISSNKQAKVKEMWITNGEPDWRFVFTPSGSTNVNLFNYGQAKDMSDDEMGFDVIRHIDNKKVFRLMSKKMWALIAATKLG